MFAGLGDGNLRGKWQYRSMKAAACMLVLASGCSTTAMPRQTVSDWAPYAVALNHTMSMYLEVGERPTFCVSTSWGEPPTSFFTSLAQTGFIVLPARACKAYIHGGPADPETGDAAIDARISPAWRTWTNHLEIEISTLKSGADGGVAVLTVAPSSEGLHVVGYRETKIY